jgi:hypothetical protein
MRIERPGEPLIPRGIPVIPPDHGDLVHALR